MKWNDDELIFVWGYYKKFGTKQSGKDYTKYLEVFRNIQNRDYSNAKNTFALKLMNIDALEKLNYANDGGLSKSKVFNKLILMGDKEELQERFKNLTLNVEDVDVPNNVAEFMKNTNQIIEIDTTNVDDYKMMANVSYEETTLKDYLSGIMNGNYKVPLFQREFVWNKKMIIGFLNAINKGYPFGNIVIWETENNNIFSERNEIIAEFRKEKKGNLTHNYTQWILDGQQRTTSIVSQLVSIAGLQKNRNIIYSLFDMQFKENDQKHDSNFVYTDSILSEKHSVLEIKERYEININDASAIEKIRRRILNTKIGITKVNNANLNTAIDIFSEMNTTGKKLSLFDIVHSKWLSSDIDFDLEKFINKWYDKKPLYVPDMITIIKSLYLTFSEKNVSSSNILEYKVTPKNIEDLKNNFEKTLDLAHDFLINIMRFKGELIPSSNLFKFIVYIYAKNKNMNLNEKQISNLKKYVKFVCLKNYYSSSTDQKMANNLEVMDSILRGENLSEDIEKVMINESEVKEIEYGDDSSKYLFIINVLFRNAKSLKTNIEVPVTSLNKKSSKINIHHIIPRTIKAEGRKIIDISHGNSLANLAPILEEENLEISNKYPNQYYEEFKNKNDKLDISLNEMLINPKYLSMIDEKVSIDALQNFWDERAKNIAAKINDSYN